MDLPPGKSIEHPPRTIVLLGFDLNLLESNANVASSLDPRYRPFEGYLFDLLRATSVERIFEVSEIEGVSLTEFAFTEMGWDYRRLPERIDEIVSGLAATTGNAMVLCATEMLPALSSRLAGHVAEIVSIDMRDVPWYSEILRASQRT